MWQRLPICARRGLKGLGWMLAALVGVVGATVLTTEARCRGTPALAGPAYQPLVAAVDRRDEVNSYLTYPEWSVVHAYEDLAGVMRAGSESDFGYWRSISGFWTSLCQVKRKAASHGPISLDYNSTLYIVGLSFTGEMGLKGLYETTIGRATAWLRGSTRTPEDDFAQALADEYAAFLKQTPWYEFPFAERLGRFWAQTPMTGGNIARKVERRVALTLEYGVKAIYAKAIGALAGLAPAALTIRSVVRDVPADYLAGERRIKVVQDLGLGQTLIETPRYRELTEIIRAVAGRGGSFVEIAGNRNILVTVLTEGGGATEPTAAQRLFSVTVQARPGVQRLGYDVRVDRLTELIRSLPAAGLALEHVYDY